MSAPKLLIFSSPSGAGKTTIVRQLLENFPQLQFSISATTRTIRKGEEDGVHYHFLTVKEFKHSISDDAFIEWEEVYDGLFYGTLKSELSRIHSSGNVAIFDIDVEGALNIKNQYGPNALTIFIQPPSIEALKTRLVKRGTDDSHSLETRLNKAEFELSYANKFDKIVVNDVLEIAIHEATDLVEAFLKV
jgi:guanylate kinase